MKWHTLGYSRYLKTYSNIWEKTWLSGLIIKLGRRLLYGYDCTIDLWVYMYIENPLIWWYRPTKGYNRTPRMRSLSLYVSFNFYMLAPVLYVPFSLYKLELRGKHKNLICCGCYVLMTWIGFDMSNIDGIMSKPQ